jgi:hypothetical protein
MWFATSVFLIDFSWIVCVRYVYDPNLEGFINFSEVFSGFIPFPQVYTRVVRNTFLLHSIMSNLYAGSGVFKQAMYYYYFYYYLLSHYVR